MAHARTRLRIKRVYDPPSSDDGTRILIDRLWPRGLKRSDAAIARWLKEIAPSTELRKWFAHDPDRWDEFCRRYRAELHGKQELLHELRSISQKGAVTLLYAARDEVHNHAVVLRDAVLHRD